MRGWCKALQNPRRGRAIATGRPVALVIERMKLNAASGVVGNDMSTRLSIGEVFPPYAGDWSGAAATISAHPTVPGWGVATLPFDMAASLWDPFSNVPSGIVAVDDVIQFGDSPQKYRIADELILSGTGAARILQIIFENPPLDPFYGVATREGTVFPATSMRFRIFRKPTKSLAANIVLPRGICIDLSVSGIGRSGRDFSAEAISNVVPPAAPPAAYYGPVSIVFSPNGNVQDIYFATAPADPTASPVDVSNSTVRHPANGIVHLLVGKTEQVTSVPSPGAYLGEVNIPPLSLSTRDDATYNILDSENVWVSINPYSGAIYSSPVQQLLNAPVEAGTSLANIRTAQARSLANAGVRSSSP